MIIRKQSKINRQVKKFLKFWLPSFIWLGFICYGSLTDSGMPEINFYFILKSDKIAHLGIYLIFAILLGRSFKNEFINTSMVKLLVFSFAMVVITGFVMEMLQLGITKSRHFEMMDVLANISGALLGTISYYFFTSSSRMAQGVTKI